MGRSMHSMGVTVNSGGLTMRGAVKRMAARQTRLSLDGRARRLALYPCGSPAYRVRRRGETGLGDGAREGGHG